jgi:hypothetical protein
MKENPTCQSSEHGNNQDSHEDTPRKVVLIPDDSRVIIRDVECRSEEVYAYMDTPIAKGDPVGALIRAFECGAMVLMRASSRSDFEHMERLANESFGRLEKTVTDFIRQNLDVSEQGTLARRISDIFRAQQDQIRETINKGDIHVTEFQKQVVTFAQSLQSTLQSTLAGVLSSDQTGLSILLRDVRSEVKNLRDAIVSKTTEGLTSPPVKGANYEDEIFQLINRWAEAIQGTVATVIVEDCRSATGPLGKQGDAVIRLIAGVESRVAVEMKTQERMSANRIIEVCRAAKENRHADMVVYVANDEENLPAEFGGWTQMDDIIITSTVGFEIALRIATGKLLLQKAQAENVGIDVEKGLALIQDIDSQLKKFNVLLTCTRATVKNAEKSHATAIEIRDGIDEATEQLVALLRGRNDKGKEDA